MRSPLRMERKLAGAICLAAAGILVGATLGRAAAPPEQVLPGTTLFFAKSDNMAKLRTAFMAGGYGQAFKDPAFKPVLDEMKESLKDTSKDLKEKVGVSLKELLTLPEGMTTLAIVGRDDPKLPYAIVIMADAGSNAAKMTSVMEKATSTAKEADAKVRVEEFMGAKITIVEVQDPKKEGDDKKKGDDAPPPLIWTSQGSVFTISTDLATMKDVLAHPSGREDSLAAGESFTLARKKLAGESHVVWFMDANKILKLVTQVASARAEKGGGAQAQQMEALLQVSGINGMKAVAGNVTVNEGKYELLTKTLFFAPAPVQGVLKMFQMPNLALKPESWVPATVATYQSASWDLDGAYEALNDLVNQFQPGMLAVFEQQMVGPNGGAPLSFKKDIFKPLGNRISVITDFKKPYTEDSQRVLLGVALEDPKAIQSTMSRLIEISNSKPKKQEFLGTDIYEFEMPDVPNPNGAAAASKGPLSVAVAKDTLFLTNQRPLLEMVLRGGAGLLSDKPDYQAYAKELPEKVALISYEDGKEALRASYEMIKSGQFEKAVKNSTGPNKPDVSFLAKLFDKDKLPAFELLSKYVTTGGSYGQMDDDGFTMTRFSLRRTNP